MQTLLQARFIACHKGEDGTWRMATGGGHSQGNSIAVYTKALCRTGGYVPGLGPMGLLTYRDEPGLTLTGHTRTVASLEFSERFLVTGCQVCMRYPCTPA